MDVRSAIQNTFSRDELPYDESLQTGEVSNVEDTSMSWLIVLEVRMTQLRTNLLILCHLQQFCMKSRWLHRANWYQTELLTTFCSGRISKEELATTPRVHAVQLVPVNTPDSSGVFKIYLQSVSPQGIPRQNPLTKVIWDREVKGGFPEVKQLVRNEKPLSFEIDNNLLH